MSEQGASSSDYVVLCDFDGTICTANTMDFLYRKFAACGMKFAERWERGEISTAEEMRATFATIDASREEMERALSTLEIDEVFPHFLTFCRQRGYDVAVVSDGLEWYIEFILGRHGISDLPIYANCIHFENGDFRFDFPWFHEDTPLRGVSKPRIVTTFKRQGKNVIYIGDGISDADAIHEADLVYARGWLAEHCTELGLEAVIFDRFDELIRKWREL